MRPANNMRGGSLSLHSTEGKIRLKGSLGSVELKMLLGNLVYTFRIIEQTRPYCAAFLSGFVDVILVSY